MEFITEDERAQLKSKLEGLIGNRSKIAERIADARALGDLKENAEYHAAREQQGFCEVQVMCAGFACIPAGPESAST